MKKRKKLQCWDLIEGSKGGAHYHPRITKVNKGGVAKSVGGQDSPLLPTVLQKSQQKKGYRPIRPGRNNQLLCEIRDSRGEKFCHQERGGWLTMRVS